MRKFGKRGKYHGEFMICFTLAAVFFLAGCVSQLPQENTPLEATDDRPAETETQTTFPAESATEAVLPTVETTEAKAEITEPAQETQGEQKLPVFTVTFLDTDGTALLTQYVEQGSNAVPPDTAPKEGYAFVGWDADYTNIGADLTVKALYELAAPAFVIGTASAKSGDENVAVTVRIEKNPGIASVGALVMYDEKLTLARIEYNEALAGQFMLPQQLTAPVKLTWISPFENVTGDCLFATLYFSVPKGTEAGLYEITLQYDPEDVYDVRENNLELLVVSGGISVTP